MNLVSALRIIKHDPSNIEAARVVSKATPDQLVAAKYGRLISAKKNKSKEVFDDLDEGDTEIAHDPDDDECECKDCESKREAEKDYVDEDDRDPDDDQLGNDRKPGHVPTDDRKSARHWMRSPEAISEAVKMLAKLGLSTSQSADALLTAARKPSRSRSAAAADAHKILTKMGLGPAARLKAGFKAGLAGNRRIAAFKADGTIIYDDCAEERVLVIKL